MGDASARLAIACDHQVAIVMEVFIMTKSWVRERDKSRKVRKDNRSRRSIKLQFFLDAGVYFLKLFITRTVVKILTVCACISKFLSNYYSRLRMREQSSAGITGL
jgi:hypothetical protein